MAALFYGLVADWYGRIW